MTLVRIDPPPRPKKNFWKKALNFGQTAFGVLTTGPGAFARPILNSASGAATKQKYRPFIPIEFDTETGKVNLVSRSIPFDKYWQRLASGYGQALVSLQAAADTGQIAVGTPKSYRQAAQIIVANRETLPQPEISDMSTITIPPGGFAGFSGMTPASKLALNGGLLKSVKAFGRTRKRRKKAKGTGTKRRKRAAGGKRRGRKLVKGSPAAKRFMAALRRKRK